ncbi:MAG TPA: DegT/DnrJ/EryC1/StrS family aminotransferase [Bacteroidia bacterium]|nr:DegT/DnrJ/EryC1/StrS family aminotransferase [Bacteroidia bacterium]
MEKNLHPQQQISQSRPIFRVQLDCLIATRHVPYHRAIISDEEIEEVVATLRSGWLTTGPRTKLFEQKFSALKSDRPAVAVQSCTGGLFLAMHGLDLQPGDEVITTPMSFVATANVILQNGGKVVFADIDPLTMNIDPDRIAEKVTPRTRAILPVHVGGNPCEMDRIMAIANAHGLEVIEDCAHSIEADFQGQPLGTFGYASAFSFYPTKNITTGEGGMIVCRDEAVAQKMRLLSGHGIAKTTWQRMEVEHNPLYDVLLPGFKYNMSDLQAALGLPQLERLAGMYERRRVLRAAYDRALAGVEGLQVVQLNPRGKAALHLYLVLLDVQRPQLNRQALIAEARRQGVELSVNYSPIHLFSYYRQAFGYREGDFPVAEACGRSVISLPFYPAMSDEDVAYVVEVLTRIAQGQ